MNTTADVARMLDGFLHDIGMVANISVMTPVHGDPKIQITMTENQVRSLIQRIQKGYWR